MAQYEGDLDYRYYAKHFVINENNNKKSQKSFSHPEPQMCFQLLVESTHITPLTTVLKNVSHRNAYF